MKVNDYYVNWDTQEFILYFKGYKKNKLDNSIIDETFYKEVIYLPINETDNIKEFEGSCEYMGLYNYYKIHQYPKDVSYKLILKPYQKFHPYYTTNLILYYDIVFFGEVVYSGTYNWEFESNTTDRLDFRFLNGITVEYEGQELRSEPVQIYLLPNSGGGDDDWESGEVDGIWYTYKKRLKWNEDKSKILYIPVGQSGVYEDYIICGINDSFLDEKTYDGEHNARGTLLPYHIIQGVKDDWSDVNISTIQFYLYSSNKEKTVEWNVTQTDFTYVIILSYNKKNGEYKTEFSDYKTFITPDFGQNLGDTQLTYNFTKTETLDASGTIKEASAIFTVYQLYNDTPEPIDPDVEYLNFTATYGDICITPPYQVETALSGHKLYYPRYVSFAYSFNGVDFELLYRTPEYSPKSICVEQGKTIYFKADRYYGYCDGQPEFKITDICECHGKITSLSQTGGESDYAFLFRKTPITTPPILLSDSIVKDYAYQGMFQGCKYLTTPPELPATTLGKHCYQTMFYECYNLEKAPILPATTLSEECYYEMFYRCTNLKYINVGATSWNEAYAKDWVYGVYPQGTFIKLSETNIPRGTSGIPAAWGYTPEPSQQGGYLRFVASYGDVNIGFTDWNRLTNPICKLDNAEYWSYFNMTTFVPSGSTLYITAEGCSYGTAHFTTSAPCQCYGDVRSLFSDGNFDNVTLTNKCFAYLFSGTKITTAPELPATTLANQCYSSMFQGCKNLIIAPELPATTLAESCYNAMFFDCVSLATAPQLPATVLKKGCYSNMFYNCINILTAPELPATTLEWYCYNNMFQGCINIRTAPELPATTLSWNCYESMFKDCISLTTVQELPATTLTDNCYYAMFAGCTNLKYIRVLAKNWNTNWCYNWVRDVSSTGTIVKPSDTYIPSGANGIPEGWTVENI